MTTVKQVRPFANGSEFETWIASNCASGPCVHYEPDADGESSGCRIECSFALAYVSTGLVDTAVAERAVIVVAGKLVVPSPACREHKPLRWSPGLDPGVIAPPKVAERPPGACPRCGSPKHFGDCTAVSDPEEVVLAELRSDEQVRGGEFSYLEVVTDDGIVAAAETIRDAQAMIDEIRRTFAATMSVGS